MLLARFRKKRDADSLSLRSVRIFRLWGIYKSFHICNLSEIVKLFAITILIIIYKGTHFYKLYCTYCSLSNSQSDDLLKIFGNV